MNDKQTKTETENRNCVSSPVENCVINFLRDEDIAVVLFAYNRVKYLKQTIRHIKGIDYAFIDKSDKQERIANILQEKTYNIRKREIHFGLSKNIIDGVTKVFSYGYKAVIIIEDDLKLKAGAVEFMKEGLKVFYNNSDVGSITGKKNGNQKRFSSYLWGTWDYIWENANWGFENIDKNGFRKIDSDLPLMYEKAKQGLTDSWAVRFAYYHFKNNLICLQPRRNLVKHIGKRGTHFKLLSIFSIRSKIRNIKTLYRLLRGGRFVDEEHNERVRRIYDELRKQAKNL